MSSTGIIVELARQPGRRHVGPRTVLWAGPSRTGLRRGVQGVAARGPHEAEQYFNRHLSSSVPHTLHGLPCTTWLAVLPPSNAHRWTSSTPLSQDSATRQRPLSPPALYWPVSIHRPRMPGAHRAARPERQRDPQPAHAWRPIWAPCDTHPGCSGLLARQPACSHMRVEVDVCRRSASSARFQRSCASLKRTRELSAATASEFSSSQADLST